MVSELKLSDLNNNWPKSKADFIQWMEQAVPDNAWVNVDIKLTRPAEDYSLFGCVEGSVEHLINKSRVRTESGEMSVSFQYDTSNT